MFAQIGIKLGCWLLSPVEALEPRSGCPLAGGGRHRGAEQPQLLRRGTGAAAPLFFVLGREVGVVPSQVELDLVAAVEDIRDVLVAISECVSHLARYAFEDLNDDRKFECGHEHQPSD